MRKSGYTDKARLNHVDFGLLNEFVCGYKIAEYHHSYPFDIWVTVLSWLT